MLPFLYYAVMCCFDAFGSNIEVVWDSARKCWSLDCVYTLALSWAYRACLECLSTLLYSPEEAF